VTTTSTTSGPDPVVLRPRTIGALGPPEPVLAPPRPVGRRPTPPADVVEAAPRRLLRANLLVASGTLTSRITGLVRTLLILFLLVEGLNDAYLNANNTPNMIYELILGGILTASLVPLFTDDLERGDGQAGTSALISFALVALAIVTLIGFLAGPALILLLSTGAPDARRGDYIAAAVPLALLFAPQIFFYGLMAVWSAALNARNKFMAAAWAPVLNNVIAIATLALAASMAGGSPTLDDALEDRRILWVLGIGTTLGIVTMAMALYPALRRAGVRLHFSFQPRHPLVRQAVRLSLWTFGYVIANQVAVIVIQILATPTSSDPTRYQTAFQWFQLPHALLAVSIMVTFQPLLGRADARGDGAAFNHHLLLGFRLIALLIIPAAVGYVALPAGLDARTFVATGNLDEALDLTGIIAAFAIGLPGFSLYLYAFRGFYAMKDTKTPFVINCIENAINIVLAVVFVQLWGVVGLALAFAVAYDLAAVLAVGALVRRCPGFDLPGLLDTLRKLLIAAVIMGGFVWGAVTLMAPSSAAMLLPAVVVGIAVGIVVYLAAVYVLAVPGFDELLARLPGRGRRGRAAA
jgi:putative peptidoglycan lipid II flippase